MGDKIVGNFNQWATSTGRNDKALAILDKRLGTNYLATSLQDRAIEKLTTSYNNGTIDLKKFDEGVAQLANNMPKTSTELENATKKAEELRDSILALAGQWGITVNVNWNDSGGPGNSNVSGEGQSGNGSWINGQWVPGTGAFGGWRSGWTMVGETGPELVNMGGGGQIYSNADSKGLGGMSGEQVGAIVGAVLSTRIDYHKLARTVRDANMQSGVR